MKKKIVLNCMPPYSVDTPSPAMSVLKAYLQYFDYTVDVIYWNLMLKELETDFIWNKQYSPNGEPDTTLLYAAYLAVKKNDQELYKEVKLTLQSIAPIMLNDGDYYDIHIAEYVEKVEQKLDEILRSFDYSNILYFGFSMKLNQWTLAAIISEKIKKNHPSMNIVVGGINTPDVAQCFLQNFKYFDIATYGEGEIPLKKISDCLSSIQSLVEANIPRTFVRQNGRIVRCPDNEKNSYSNLSDKRIIPVYNDFFETLNQIKLNTKPTIIIEGSRGCHWNKCHFCYLNKGYRYRRKDIATIIYEIRKAIDNYGIYRFEFADNDVIGNDQQQFIKLLDELKTIKEEYPSLSIISFEIITPGVSRQIIEQMKEAGVRTIQIGYESANDSLLKKIEKKNTFASNLNVIKHCSKNQISVSGINVIRNLLEETVDDIYQSIENLRFYRFIINKTQNFIHIPILLGINSSSKYYNQIQAHKEDYAFDIGLFQKTFAKLLDDISKWHLFESSKTDYSTQWNFFNTVQYHYYNNEYQYRIVRDGNNVTYVELYNGNELESFSLSVIQQVIIKLSYDLSISIEQLTLILKSQHQEVQEEDIRNNINYLYSKGIVYHSDNYEEIISIININSML